MDERRHTKRIQLSLPVLAASPNLTTNARIINLSSTGAFIATERPLPEDSSLAIDIQLPGEAERMTINARIVWTKSFSNATPAGMGIEFTDILDRHQNQLADFIEQDIGMEGTPQ